MRFCSNVALPPDVLRRKHRGQNLRERRFAGWRVSMASGYDQQQLTLWQEKVRLDEGFLKSLREHPVPVREEAISAIGTRSLQIRVSGPRVAAFHPR